MCEPCRDRYRNYGITKRRKWKAERVAFEQELDNLRDVEDERRRGLGLTPLSDSPDELFDWEQSIVDEKISMPENIEALVSAYSSLSPQTLLTAMPDQSLALSTASIQSLGQTSSDKPVPNLPPHMCTVSHCHKILPGSYLFKRCEQHRLQNRHHSQLKRVREKEVKSVGPPEGSVGETFEIGRDSQSLQEDADADDDDVDEQVPPPKRRKKEKGPLPDSNSPEPTIDYEAEYVREKERAEVSLSNNLKCNKLMFCRSDIELGVVLLRTVIILYLLELAGACAILVALIARQCRPSDVLMLRRS